MINGKKYGVLLQVLIVLFAFFVLPAAANEPPTVLEGNLLVDGQPAVAGTEVTVVVDGNVVGATTVTNKGLFGDDRSNRLGVSSSYDAVTIYVDGVETQTLKLSDYQSDEAISLDLSATSPVKETPAVEDEGSGTTAASPSRGGGGFSNVATTETVEEETIAEESESVPQETALPSTEDEVIDDETSPVTTPESKGVIAVFGLVLAGVVVVSYGYRSKK